MIDWEWNEVTTILFTGQTTKIPIVRKSVEDLVKTKHKNPSKLKFVPLKNPTGLKKKIQFDPKLCVSEGAVLWKTGGFRIHLPKDKTQLPNDLKRKANIFDWDIILPKGEPFPAKAIIKVGSRNFLHLFLGEESLCFFKFEQKYDQVEIHIQNLKDIKIITPDKKVYTLSPDQIG